MSSALSAPCCAIPAVGARQGWCIQVFLFTTVCVEFRMCIGRRQVTGNSSGRSSDPRKWVDVLREKLMRNEGTW